MLKCSRQQYTYSQADLNSQLQSYGANQGAKLQVDGTHCMSTNNKGWAQPTGNVDAKIKYKI